MHHQWEPGTVAILGLPFDGNSSFERGTAKAPAPIRAALQYEARNLCTEKGLDLAVDRRWDDAGDLDLTDEEAAFATIEEGAADLLRAGARPVFLGGDHSVTYPVMKAFAAVHPGLTILQLDAHPDLYDSLDGNRFSHACPFARIMEEGLATRLVQVGIRTATTHQREQAARFGVETIEAKDWRRDHMPAFEGPVYLSLDMDCFDPAHAPGVSHPEPGGLTARDVLGIVQNLGGTLVGADIVEYNVQRDVNGMTAVLAAKMLKEIVGRMLTGEGGAE